MFDFKSRNVNPIVERIVSELHAVRKMTSGPERVERLLATNHAATDALEHLYESEGNKGMALIGVVLLSSIAALVASPFVSGAVLLGISAALLSGVALSIQRGMRLAAVECERQTLTATIDDETAAFTATGSQEARTSCSFRRASTGPSTKLALNFRHCSTAEVRNMAASTLESAGFDPSIADPKVGDKMPDGTIYAGDSPDTGKPMYTTPADAPLTMKWQEAMDYAKRLDAHGHDDWRLPSKGELNVLFNYRAELGEFDVGGSGPANWYWSGTQVGKSKAWEQRFRDGYQYRFPRRYPSSVRCVR